MTVEAMPIAEHAPGRGGAGGALLSFDRLTLSARIGGRDVAVLHDLSFDVAPGRVLGLVGESGAGKSMIGRVVAGLTPPGFRVAGGGVHFEGLELTGLSASARRALLGRRIAFIPQEPLTALNPVMTIGALFDEHLGHLGVPKAQRAALIRAQLAAVALPTPDELVGRYAHQLSGGQCQRVLIAMAYAADPALIVADEPTTALDVVSQATVLRLLAEQRRSHGTAVLMITHDLRLAAHVCDEIVVLYAGEVVERGPAAEVLSRSRHPYTRALQDATPDVRGEMRRLPVLRGQMPGVAQLADIRGCRFAARCPTAAPACADAPPGVREAEPGHWVRCAEACQVRSAALPASGGRDDAAGGPSSLAAGGSLAAGPPAAGSPAAGFAPVGDAAATPVVELRGVGLRYSARRGLFGGQAAHTDAVIDFSLAVQPGEFVGIVGESGSGKSSVAKLIVGAQHLTSGSLWVEGRDTASATADERARIRRRVQMIFQDPHSALNPRRTVERLLTQVWEADALGPAAGADAAGERGDRAARALDLLGDVGLPADAAPRFPSQLSGGQKQRVNIGRALCTMPHVVVADEIVSGLDVSVQAQILNLLLELGRRHRIALILISHDLSVVRYLCSRVVVMQRGRVVEQGTTEAVFANPQHPYTRLLLASVPPADPTQPWPPDPSTAA